MTGNKPWSLCHPECWALTEVRIENVPALSISILTILPIWLGIDKDKVIQDLLGRLVESKKAKDDLSRRLDFYRGSIHQSHRERELSMGRWKSASGVLSFTSTRIDHVRDHAKIWHKDDYFSRGLKSLEKSKDNFAERKRYEREVRKRFDLEKRQTGTWSESPLRPRVAGRSL